MSSDWEETPKTGTTPRFPSRTAAQTHVGWTLLELGPVTVVAPSRRAYETASSNPAAKNRKQFRGATGQAVDNSHMAGHSDSMQPAALFVPSPWCRRVWLRTLTTWP